ncbi:MAG: phosphoribosylformylglycinamidine cyclo-ligase [Ignavibacteria bacterium]|nr:phosphoribosylformylglycinamidine cyclo-ligase [Ignavibacteria bacterium]
MDYKSSGVDISAGEALVDAIKPFVKKTRTAGVMSEIGLFGGFFDARFPGYEHPILVASTDGVGTKLNVAIMANKHYTVGQCLVNHCTNDILACGAKPLFFLDYYATGKLNVNSAVDVVKGLAKACEENGCALLGGETAEMPSLYAEGDYDIAGTIVGVVDKPNIIDGKKIAHGDVLIALPSTGLHTNGFSLARAALFPKYKIDQYVEELGTTIGEALLAVHKSYAMPLLPIIERRIISGLSHITGGGIVGNTSRILPKGYKLNIDWEGWDIPAIFKLIQSAGSIHHDEMRHVFNLGIGMLVIANEENAQTIISELSSLNPFVVGNIKKAS